MSRPRKAPTAGSPLPAVLRLRRPTLLAFALALALAVGAAILFAVQTYLAMLPHGHSWWRLLVWQLLCWSFWAAVGPAVASAGARLQRRSTPAVRWLPAHAAAALGLIAAHQLLSAAATVLVQPFVPVERMGVWRALEYLSLPWAWIDLLVYGLLLAVGFAAAAAERRRELELRESRLEAELARAQLQTLRLELQPHFLFNTLNSIAALVRKRAHAEALETILDLSHLLRMTLDRSDRHWVPLDEEIAFVRRYVELQRRRFADRLRVRWDVDPSCGAIEVPTLVLQPLVENAIRHGIAERPEGGSIEIRARCAGDELRLEVCDDGPGPPEDLELEVRAGVGLGGTRSRLRHLYGDRARLRLERREAGGAMAEVVLPVDLAPALGREAVPAAAPAAAVR